MIRIYIKSLKKNPRISRKKLESIAREVLESECVPNEKDYEISITLVDNRYIQGLNRKYRGVDSPTDVLAFPIEVSHGKFLGDIYISLDRASEQVEEKEDLRKEVSRLLVHGVLHLLGYEHSPEMFARQEFYLNEGNQRSKIKGQNDKSKLKKSSPST